MKKAMIGAQLAAAVLLSASAAVAAPCTTDRSKNPDKTFNPKSSDVDKTSENLAGGNQPASPGTIGAMNNAGANQVTQTTNEGGKKSPEAGPGAQNLAGGNQPASPGTIGAMNDAEVTTHAAPEGGDC